MNSAWWPVIGQVLVLAGVIVTVVWGQRHSKAQPVLDMSTAEHTGVDTDRLRKTIERLNEQTNAVRDTHMALLRRYLMIDLADWQAQVMTNERMHMALTRELIAEVQRLGGDTSGIIVPPLSPPPPPIPEPPTVPG